jgi:hypothetical protein
LRLSLFRPLQPARHPFPLGRGLEQDPAAGPIAERGREALGLGADPLFDQLAAIGQDSDQTFLLVDIDANIVHGCPLLSRR